MKLTAKLLLCYCAVCGLLLIWLLAAVVPGVRTYLTDRELNNARSFVVMSALESQSWFDTANGSPSSAAGPILFQKLREDFNKFFTYESGMLFVLDSSGQTIVRPDAIVRGRAVSDELALPEQSLIDTIVKDRSGQVNVHQVTQSGIDKTYFTAYITGSEYFVCVSVNDADLYYSADKVTRSLCMVSVVAILVFFAVFCVLYHNLKRRYDAVLASAEAVAGGNYDVAVSDEAPDEIGILGRTIETLADTLREKQVLEEQLRRAQKMETVGTLASGITHDFNNILGGINGAIDLVLRELENPMEDGQPDTTLIQQMSQVVSNCVRRGRDTVEQLMSFSRKSEEKQQIVDLNSVVSNVQKICENSFDKRVEINWTRYSKEAPVLADRSLLEQALLNICINARDAMKDGGTITIIITREEDVLIPGQLERADSYFKLTIKDQGCGMDEETKDNIFEPFFTTKPRGEGTGLGMAMVFKIVNEQRGWIDLESTVGKGTEFYIYLPYEPGEIEEEATTTIIEEHNGGDALILVIEDDKILRDLCVSFLQREGYQTLSAKDGAEGVRVFNEKMDHIDGVLLDLILPQLGGEEVYHKIKEKDANARVLLTSGSGGQRIQDLMAAGCNGFLRKPFSMDELSAAIKQLTEEEEAVVQS